MSFELFLKMIWHNLRLFIIKKKKKKKVRIKITLFNRVPSSRGIKTETDYQCGETNQNQCIVRFNGFFFLGTASQP
jgi:hypothetical protein